MPSRYPKAMGAAISTARDQQYWPECQPCSVVSDEGVGTGGAMSRSMDADMKGSIEWWSWMYRKTFTQRNGSDSSSETDGESALTKITRDRPHVTVRLGRDTSQYRCSSFTHSPPELAFYPHPIHFQTSSARLEKPRRSWRPRREDHHHDPSRT